MILLIDGTFAPQCDGGWRGWRRRVGCIVDVVVVVVVVVVDDIWRAEGCQHEHVVAAAPCG